MVRLGARVRAKGKVRLRVRVIPQSPSAYYFPDSACGISAYYPHPFDTCQVECQIHTHVEYRRLKIAHHSLLRR